MHYQSRKCHWRSNYVSLRNSFSSTNTELRVPIELVTLTVQQSDSTHHRQVVLRRWHVSDMSVDIRFENEEVVFRGALGQDSCGGASERVRGQLPFQVNR
eukprot:821066-Pyramimonas_sp.AAC.1